MRLLAKSSANHDSHVAQAVIKLRRQWLLQTATRDESNSQTRAQHSTNCRVAISCCWFSRIQHSAVVLRSISAEVVASICVGAILLYS